MKIKDPLFDDVIIRRVVFKIEKKNMQWTLLKRDRIKIQRFSCQHFTLNKSLGLFSTVVKFQRYRILILGIDRFWCIFSPYFKPTVKIQGSIFNRGQNSTLHCLIFRKWPRLITFNQLSKSRPGVNFQQGSHFNVAPSYL